MSWETFQQTLEFLRQEPAPGRVVGLHHFGESLLHPQVEEFLQELEKQGLSWRLSTNGRLLARQEIRRMLLAQQGLLVISLENGARLANINALLREKAEQGSRLQIMLQTFGDTDLSQIIPGHYQVAQVERHTWAHQGRSNPAHCCFLVQDWVCILWDGSIVSCCMDLEGEGHLGHVTNGRQTNRPWRSCQSCEVVMQCSPATRNSSRPAGTRRGHGR